jgi:transposase-like protein
MARKKGQIYTAQQKTKIVLELLKEDQTLNQLATKYKITSRSIQNWKKQFLDNASLAFDDGKATDRYKKEIKKKEDEIDELHRQLGKSTVKAEFLEKKLKSLDSYNKKILVETKHKKLSILEQCKILGIARSSYYYKPKPMSQKDIKILHAMDATLATDVLNEALEKYPKPKIFNSDQGSQYTSKDHTDILKEHDIQISMNGKGRSVDNIMIEGFFRTLKHNNIYINDYKTIKELKYGIAEYIHKYNFKRFHSSIDYQKPMMQSRRYEDNVYLESVKMVA